MTALRLSALLAFSISIEDGDSDLIRHIGTGEVQTCLMILTAESDPATRYVPLIRLYMNSQLEVDHSP